MSDTNTATTDTTTATTTTPPAAAPTGTPAAQFAGKYATEAEFASALSGIATKRGLDFAVPDGKKLIGDVFTKEAAEMLYKQLAGKPLTADAPPAAPQQPVLLDDAGVRAEIQKAGVDINAIVAQDVSGTAPSKEILTKIGSAALKANPELVGRFVLNHDKLSVMDYQRRTADAQTDAKKMVGGDKADKMLEWAKNNLGDKQAEWESRWKNPATAATAMLELSGLYAIKVPPSGPADTAGGMPSSAGMGGFTTSTEWKVALDEASRKYGDPMEDPVYRARAIATAKTNPSIMR